ncbi:uncharacterized protein LOC115891682 [Sitophilus oryzae]|uniref:Uncharacterized protein LOC115891682 n=1 Tax=Sitophilus oryzae TaxID=7048 RepID=A0A6J2YZ36_SITOR|nr:uncharacterized protein LOC115891682 [Sitophilus oryzae]
MRIPALFLLFCAATATISAETNSIEGAGFRALLKVYDECGSASGGFSTCLKKKAITFLDRLGRMEKLSILDGVALVKSPGDQAQEIHSNLVTENEIDKNLPRSIEDKDAALNTMLMDKASSILSSRTIEISVPKVSELIEEGRGGKMKDMMGGMMMAIAAKMAALIPIAIAGLFLLAGKALVTAKIALLISGIIALKKLFAAKHQHHTAHSSGWTSGGGGGWQPSGGGWDRRSIEEAQRAAAYKAYKQA